MIKLIYCAQPGRLSDKRKQVMDYVINQEHAPLHPFLAYPYELYEGGFVGRKKTMEFCQRLIDITDEFWLYGISEGTLEDLVYALKIGKPVKLHLDFDPEWKVYYERLGQKYNYPLEKIKKQINLRH